jgi:gluconate kinase
MVAVPHTRQARVEYLGHYMPASLLDTQLETLEPLDPTNPGWSHPPSDRSIR